MYLLCVCVCVFVLKIENTKKIKIVKKKVGERKLKESHVNTSIVND